MSEHPSGKDATVRVSDRQAHQWSREDFTSLASSFGPALADCAADLIDARARIAAWEPVVRAALDQYRDSDAYMGVVDDAVEALPREHRP